jgi:hypothetical protein
MNVLLATSDHELGPSNGRAGPIDGRPVTIGDGCWIGGNVSIMPGVTIGSLRSGSTPQVGLPEPRFGRDACRRPTTIQPTART